MGLFNKLIATALPAVPKPLVHQVAKRYIAGEEEADAIRVAKSLNDEGLRATINILGEHETSEESAAGTVEAYLRLLEDIGRDNVDGNLSIKPTQLGMSHSYELCQQNYRRVLRRARELGIFVRIDMEDSSVTSATLRLYREMRAEFEQVGVVIQAYLRRSLADIHDLMDARPNIRLCKGIYIEPRKICYRDPVIINGNFSFLLEEMLKRGCYVGIATHDERLVWEAMRIVHRLGVDRDAFEFQMLLGVDEELRNIILDSGYKLRVYIPFGREWYAYSVRRLKENPQIAGNVLRAMFGR